MTSFRHLSALLSLGFVLAFPILAFSQAATNTPTNSFTPNPTLTPPCGASANTLGATTGSSGGSSTNTMRASMVSLSVPATVYSLWLECPTSGIQVMTGIYTGSVGFIGGLLVSSSPQTALVGWNGFPITPTYLSPGNYWLAYCYNITSYTPFTTTSAMANALAYTSGALTFGTIMPSSMPGTISYDSATPYISDAIYAAYCVAPTVTPTPSNSPTSSFTPTLSPTFILTSTPTNTGTILTNTATLSNTPSSTSTLTFSPTVTYSPTPNLSLTPPCTGSIGTFGNTSSAGNQGPAGYNPSMWADTFSLAVTATVYTMEIYNANVQAGTKVATGIYRDNSGSPGNFMVGSAAQAVTNGWNIFAMPVTTLVPGNYWLAFEYSAPVSYTLTFTAPSGATTTAYYSTSTSITPGLFPVTIPGAMPVTGVLHHDAIYVNYCPGSLNTPTPNLSLTPGCGVSSLLFGSTNTTPTPVVASLPSEMWASRYTMPSDGMVETISLYAPAQDAGYQANVALFTNDASTTTMGNLVNQSGPTPQILSAGWNVFQIPNSPVTAGDYWLTYSFSSSPVTAYYVVYQTFPTPTPNSQAYVVSPSSWTYPVSASTWVPSYTSGSQPIYANYCPGIVNTATSTNSPTTTPTSTISNTPSNTGTPTITSTPTLSPTPTVSMTPTASPTNSSSNTPSNSPTVTFTGTPTFTPTITSTPTNSATNSPTITATNSPTVTPSSTPSNSPTITSTNNPSSSPTKTPPNTATNSPTNTPTFTPTSSPTFTPTNSATQTPTNSSTDSMTPSPSASTTASLTPISSPTQTKTNTGTPTASPTPTPTASPTTTNTPTPTPTDSVTPRANATASSTSTSTFISSWTVSPTPTATQTSTGTTIATFTPTVAMSPVPAPVLWPNPLKGKGPTNLRVIFNEPHDYVIVKVFTTAYRKVYETRINFVSGGLFTYSLEPANFNGSAAANGLYYVVLTTPSERWVSKLLILK